MKSNYSSMSTNNLQSNINSNHNYAKLYGLQSNNNSNSTTENQQQNYSQPQKNHLQMNNQKHVQIQQNNNNNNVNQQIKNNEDVKQYSRSPSIIELNITPYIPKTQSKQEGIDQRNSKREQQQYLQQNQENQSEQIIQEMNDVQIPQNDQYYNFNYKQMLMDQNINLSAQNSNLLIQNSNLTLQNNKLAHQLSKQLSPLSNKTQQQLSQDNQINTIKSNQQTQEYLINKYKTPSFIASQQQQSQISQQKNNLYLSQIQQQQQQQSFSHSQDTTKNNSTNISSAIVFNEDNSNKQTPTQIILNNQFDISSNEQKQFNKGMDQQNEIENNNQKQPHSSQNLSNASLPSIQNQYFHRTITFKNHLSPTSSNINDHISPSKDMNNLIQNIDFNSSLQGGNKMCIQSCTNSPNRNGNYNHRQQHKNVKSLNVSQHLEEFQMQQQEVLHEQQKQLNSQLKKVQSLQNSFIQNNNNNEFQNELSTISNFQIIPSSKYTNNQTYQQSYSNKKILDELNSTPNHNNNNFQDLQQSEIETYLTSMNEIWAKLQVAIKTKIIREKQQSSDDSSGIDQLNQAKCKIQFYERELALKEQAILNQQNENEKLKGQVNNLTNKVQYLSENVNCFQSEQNDLIKSLQNKLQEKDNQIQNLQLQLKKKYRVDLNTSRTEKESEIVHLKQLLIQKTDIITDLKIKNQMMQEELLSMNSYRNLKEDIPPEKEQVLAKKTEYNLLKQKIGHLEEDLKRFTNEINKK